MEEEEIWIAHCGLLRSVRVGQDGLLHTEDVCAAFDLDAEAMLTICGQNASSSWGSLCLDILRYKGASRGQTGSSEKPFALVANVLVWLRYGGETTPVEVDKVFTLDELCRRFDLDPLMHEVFLCGIPISSPPAQLYTVPLIKSHGQPFEDGSRERPFTISDRSRFRFSRRGVLVDTSTEEIGSIFQACDAFNVSSSNTWEGIRDFLLDIGSLLGKVPCCCAPPTKEFFYSPSSFAVSIASTIQMLKPDGQDDLVVFADTLPFYQILRRLTESAPGDKRLRSTMSADRNKVFPPCIPSFAKQRRACYRVEVDGTPCFLGKLKDSSWDIIVAPFDLSAIELPPAFIYGDVRFVVCIARAGNELRFYIRDTSGQDAARHLAGPYDMSRAEDRAKVILVHIKLYFLLLGTQGSLRTERRTQLFHTTVLKNQSKVVLFRDSCRKKIRDWETYAAQMEVNFVDVKRAYCTTRFRCPHLVSACGSPTLREDGVYEVLLSPIGGRVMISTEQELKWLGRDVLSALDALHSQGLVHRDVRLENVICVDYSHDGNFVLIDLEGVKEADSEVGDAFRLVDWTRETLVWRSSSSEAKRKRPTGVYAKTSDLYQLGVMLKGLVETKRISLSASGASFIADLKSHTKEAKSLHEHPCCHLEIANQDFVLTFSNSGGGVDLCILISFGINAPLRARPDPRTSRLRSRSGIRPGSSNAQSLPLRHFHRLIKWHGQPFEGRLVHTSTEEIGSIFQACDAFNVSSSDTCEGIRDSWATVSEVVLFRDCCRKRIHDWETYAGVNFADVKPLRPRTSDVASWCLRSPSLSYRWQSHDRHGTGAQDSSTGMCASRMLLASTIEMMKNFELEGVKEADSEVGDAFRLADWTRTTLVWKSSSAETKRKRPSWVHAKTSDLYQLGVLLEGPKGSA
ncbi:hypothetical protein SELMODRAFT_431692 [Selaginella moellendorffii]|uniref:non-specific serine/threonine protein kinase n=1 Tax=Selaginella moellendorffii TaxID=88036 RepID=D8TDG7_SELML|nr:hypothetical protein SELMODRAFT_431692 [Selaginella moellendorffii]